jgi:hypothetical protein
VGWSHDYVPLHEIRWLRGKLEFGIGAATESMSSGAMLRRFAIMSGLSNVALRRMIRLR